MKRFMVVLTMLLLAFDAEAKVVQTRVNKFPQGVFKKTWNGDIVQYNNGKKAHTYKMKKGKVVKIK